MSTNHPSETDRSSTDDPQLTAFSLGEFEGDEAEVIEKSIAADPRRARTVEEILEAAAVLQNGFAKEPGLFLTSEQRANILKGRIPRRSLDKPLPWAVETFPVAESIRKVARTQHRGFVLGLTAAAAVLTIGLFVGQQLWDRPVTELGLDRSVSEMIGERRAINVAFDGVPEIAEAVHSAPETLWASDVRIDYPVPRFDDVFLGDAPGDDGGLELETVAAGQTARSEAFVVAEATAMDGAQSPSALWLATRDGVAVGTSLPERNVPASAVFIPSKGDEVDSGIALRDKAVFLQPLDAPVSTIDPSSDATNYANLRYFLTTYGTLPPAELVSVGDLVNYFDYGYPAPSAGADDPARVSIERAACPWNPGHQLVRIGLKVRPEVERGARAASRDVVLLVDASSEMAAGSKLPMVLDAFNALLDRVGDGGRVAGIAYGGSSFAVLEPTPASERATIRAALASMTSPAAAVGGRDLKKAVSLASKFFPRSAGARVIAISDGSSSSGRELASALGSIASRVASVDIVGLGLEIINDQDGLRAIDAAEIAFHHAGSAAEARRALDHVGGVPAAVVAENALLQVEFNPSSVLGYRLLTSRRTVLGALGSSAPSAADRLVGGEEVTAIYEIIPTEQARVLASNAFAEPLRYQQVARELTDRAAQLPGHDELLTFRLSWQAPGEAKAERQSLETVLRDSGEATPLLGATEDFRFAVAVAGFGMLLGDVDYTGTLDFEGIAQLAEAPEARDHLGLRREFRQLVEASRALLVR